MKLIHGPRAKWQTAALVAFGLGIMAAQGCGPGDNVLTSPDGSSTVQAPGPSADSGASAGKPAARKGQTSRREFEKEKTP